MFYCEDKKNKELKINLTYPVSTPLSLKNPSASKIIIMKFQYCVFVCKKVFNFMIYFLFIYRYIILLPKITVGLCLNLHKLGLL